jgi:hypothetical protein
MTGMLFYCRYLEAADEVDPKEIVANPREFINRTVTVKVTFVKINNVFRGWEDQANLRAGKYIKFITRPLGEIACYADKTDENTELIGGLKFEQEVTLTGYIKKAKFEARVKGEHKTWKGTV